MTAPIFDQTHPKNHWDTFCFPEFAPPCKKSVLFHQFILEIQPILESSDHTVHTHFWPRPCKKILITFWLIWICINMQKNRLFHWLVLEIWLIKKSCNLIGWEHFGPNLRNQNFPKYGICAGTQQII